MMTLKLLRMLGPALRGKSPELRGEPGIQYVFILVYVMAATLGADIGILHKSILPATVIAVKDRDAMTPPKLPRNVPVTKVIHPREIGLRPALGMEGYVSFANRLCSGLFKLINGNKPLLGEPWLKRSTAAIAVHDRVLKVFDVVEKVMRFKPGYDSLACLVAIHAGKLTVAINDYGMFVEDVNLLKAMGLTHSKVIGVMRRSDLDKTGAKSGIDMPIRENRDLTSHDGQHDRRAYQGSFLGILGRDRNARIAEHRLGTSGCHRNVFNAADRLFQRIAQIPQMTLLVSIFRLVIGDGRFTVRTPVYDTLTAVDKVMVIPVHKDLTHGAGILRRHRELLIIKVNGAAHALNLLDDGATVLTRPIPASLNELLATNLKARNPFRFQLFINLRLRGDTRVVGAEDPACGIAAHAAVADVGILDGIVHGVAHVENTGNVRWRNHNGAIFCAFAAAIAAGLYPLFDQLRLGSLRVIGLWHFFHGVCAFHVL